MMEKIGQFLQYAVLIGGGALVACSQFETGYFQSKVGQATQDAVAHRYGEPHKIDKL